MKHVCAGLLILCSALSAQKPVWQPTAGHTQVPIWPGAVPDPQPTSSPEFAETTPKEFPVGTGRPATGGNNVTRPTMTVYSPKVNNTGVAVVVFPGGGYQSLAIDLGGTDVCDWLVPRGITCVLLKYRVTNIGPYPKSGPYPESPMALEDAQRTVGLVRLHAAELHIDPRKIGVLGFSSGGHLVAVISTHFTGRIYKPIDAADKVSCRPDFAIPIYPGHLSLHAAEWDTRQGKSRYVTPASVLSACKGNELCLIQKFRFPARHRRRFCCRTKTIMLTTWTMLSRTTSPSRRRRCLSRCTCTRRAGMPLGFAEQSYQSQTGRSS